MTAATLQQTLQRMAQWPATWQIEDQDEIDLRCGEELVQEFKSFITYLMEVEKLSRATIRRHLDNLFLLGGEIISQINTYEEDRKLPAARLLDQNLDVDGGPLCKHARDGAAQQQYDATCKKLYAFRAGRHSSRRSRE